MGTATDYDVSSLRIGLDSMDRRLQDETESRREEAARLRDEHYKLRSRVSDLELRITARTCIGLLVVEILVIMILASRL